MGLLVLDEVTDVSVHFGEDEGYVKAKADLAAPDRLHRGRSALIHV